jgi:hypothetical protein
MLKTSPMQISESIMKDFLVIVGPPFVIRIEKHPALSNAAFFVAPPSKSG